MIFAKKGELVTCDKGHPICRVAEDIDRGGRITTKLFDEWTITPPKPFEKIEPCWCGSEYIRTDGRQLHVGGEWRPRKKIISG